MESRIKRIIRERYSADIILLLNDYFKNGDKKEKSERLLSNLLKEIIMSFKGNKFKITERLIKNNEHIRVFVIKEIENLLKLPSKEKTMNFFKRNHEFIKYSLNQWWLVNPGILFELINIPQSIENHFRKWLKDKFEVKPGDLVLYRHTISEKGRKRLINIGFPVSYKHWNKSYTIDSLVEASKILSKLKECKGIWNEGSWLYSPNIFKMASDKKPYAAFSFLNNPLVYGHRIYLGSAKSKNKYKKHLNFAVRNPRRKKMIENGELKIKIYGIFYSREEFLKNVDKIVKI